MNICADCQNPINTCCWEREFKPVEGWVAEKTKVLVLSPALGNGRKETESYNVIDCPLFTPPPGYKRNQIGIPKPVIAQDVRTREETIYPSVKKAAGALGVTEGTISKVINSGGILYGKQLRYAKVGDGL